MKTIKQVEFDKLVTLHELWLSDKSKGKRLIIKNGSIRDIVCKGRRVDNSEFNNSRFDNSRFDNSRFYYSEFFNSEFYNSEFINSKFINSKFINSKFINSKFINSEFKITDFLHGINWGNLSNKLILELMRHDALYCGEESMTKWAENGTCPYLEMQRDFIFREQRELWKPGKPKLYGKALFDALCTEKNIQITYPKGFGE